MELNFGAIQTIILIITGSRTVLSPILLLLFLLSVPPLSISLLSLRLPPFHLPSCSISLSCPLPLLSVVNGSDLYVRSTGCLVTF